MRGGAATANCAHALLARQVRAMAASVRIAVQDGVGALPRAYAMRKGAVRACRRLDGLRL